MYKNNFDCSSTGLNIEVSACYDSDCSRIMYDDMYNTYYSDKQMGVALCVRTYDFNLDKLPTTVGEVGYFKNKGNHGPITKETMVEILNEYHDYSYDAESFTMQELKDELKDIDIRYVPDLLHYFGAYYHLNDGVALYVSRGYCQGDVVNVLCKKEMAEEGTTIDHELWDCPIGAHVTISGCEYNYYDFEGCLQYEWNKKGFIEGVVTTHTNNLELQERIRQQLEVMLPDELDVV